MPIDFQDTEERLRKITITGRLDIPGTDEIANRFAALATTSARQVLVDLTGVSFLASIGIRAIITNAKALQQRGGRMVLFVGGNAAIASTLEVTGIDALIPMFADLTQAEAALAA